MQPFQALLPPHPVSGFNPNPCHNYTWLDEQGAPAAAPAPPPQQPPPPLPAGHAAHAPHAALLHAHPDPLQSYPPPPDDFMVAEDDMLRYDFPHIEGDLFQPEEIFQLDAPLRPLAVAGGPGAAGAAGLSSPAAAQAVRSCAYERGRSPPTLLELGATSSNSFHSDEQTTCSDDSSHSGGLAPGAFPPPLHQQAVAVDMYGNSHCSPAPGDTPYFESPPDGRKADWLCAPGAPGAPGVKPELGLLDDTGGRLRAWGFHVTSDALPSLPALPALPEQHVVAEWQNGYDLYGHKYAPQEYNNNNNNMEDYAYNPHHQHHQLDIKGECVASAPPRTFAL